jgi:quinol monooxygenase YgiN
MITITAILKAVAGQEEVMAEALLAVAANVRANEPGTLGFFVSRKLDDPRVFMTYERFVDRAAIDTHNNSAAVAEFFAIAKPILDGPVVLEIGEEISVK